MSDMFLLTNILKQNAVFPINMVQTWEFLFCVFSGFSVSYLAFTGNNHSLSWKEMLRVCSTRCCTNLIKEIFKWTNHNPI